MRTGSPAGLMSSSALAVDDSALRGLGSPALRRAVLGIELQFHHDLLVSRAEALRVMSPLTWAIEASVLRTIAAVLAAELHAEGAHTAVREHALLTDDSLLEGLGELGPIGVLTRHLCRATCDAVDVVRAEGTEELESAYRCALESLSSRVWPCASALDDRAWWVLQPQLARTRREVVAALSRGAPRAEQTRLYREVWTRAHY